MPSKKPSSSAIAFSNPNGLYDPTVNAYTHVAVVAPGSRLVLISGQGGYTPDGPPTQPFEEQARQVFKNIAIALESVGARVEDVVRLTILIVGYDKDRLAAYHAAQREAFGDHHPVGTLIPVTALAIPGMLIEVEATAVLPA
jgi:enamine deaminase RidA (YjgF/YER057c/UK114 family)